jgi:hypothetical protein
MKNFYPFRRFWGAYKALFSINATIFTLTPQG